MEYLQKVQRSHDGTILNFQTSTGRIISYRKAVQEVKDGCIAGVMLNEANHEYEQLSAEVNGDTLFQEYPDIF
ncbi:DUF3892 domain-containing protein [Bacillus spongiae]|uniref:DUF3892 domain-containing protein n=1 Tax=Bacillus spongiae TaxID=2683610 RepID=A0ABU8HDK5_9BACI